MTPLIFVDHHFTMTKGTQTVDVIEMEVGEYNPSNLLDGSTKSGQSKSYLILRFHRET